MGENGEGSAPVERKTVAEVLHANIDVTADGHVVTVLVRALTTGVERQAQAGFDSLAQCCDYLGEIEYRELG